MKFSKATGTLSLAALAIIASPLALADEAGWYGGLSVGQTRARIDDPRIVSGLLGQGFTTTSINDDNRDTGYKVFAGYQFNKNFALEGGYFDLGKFGFTAATTSASLLPGTLNGNIKLSGVNLDAVGTAPINERFSVIGRLGINYAEAKDSFSGTGAVSVADPSPKKHDTNYKLGVGVQYAFSPLWALRAEAERYRVNDAVGNKGDIDLWSLGLTYRFAKNGSR
jgi:OOP family OmpA-OmpF porin